MPSGATRHGLVRRDHVRVGAALEQQARRLLSPAENRQMQRREAVSGEGVYVRRIVVQDPAKSVEPAERSSLEHRQLVVRGQQLPGPLRVSRVQGLQRLAHRLPSFLGWDRTASRAYDKSWAQEQTAPWHQVKWPRPCSAAEGLDRPVLPSSPPAGAAAAELLGGQQATFTSRAGR